MSRETEPFRIVFICTGNICRSPAAENIFREMVDRAGLLPDLEIDSAGTGDWHEDDPIDHRSAAALADAASLLLDIGVVDLVGSLGWRPERRD